MHDTEGRIVRANRAYAARAGCDLEDLPGRHYWQIFPPIPLPSDSSDFEQDADLLVHELQLATGEMWTARRLRIRDEHGSHAATLCVLQEAATRPGAHMAERRFQALVENAPDFVVILDRDGVMRYVSPTVRRMSGYEPEELTDRNYLEFVHTDDVSAVRDSFAEVLREPESVIPATFRYLAKDGSWRMIETLARNLLDAPEIQGIIINTHDVTERLQAARAEQRLNRALRLLSGCNSALVHAKNETALLDEICRMVISLGQYRMTWVGFAQRDDDESVAPVARAGADDGYVDLAAVTWADTERGRGPAGTAIREQRTVVMRDLRANPAFAPWLEEAVKHGYAACVALPVTAGDRTFGALSIYAAEAEAFDAEEVNLLEELASDLGYGIFSLREAGARERLEQELEYHHNHDFLTELPNRKLFDERLVRDISQARRSGRVLPVLMIGIDRFQIVNDSFGRGSGDAFLKHVSQCLSGSLREGDTLARLSGDEFAVSLSEVEDANDVALVARRLQAAAERPLDISGRAVSATVSVGISIFPKDGVEPDTLLQSAESAMHDAKTAGGNTLRFYTADTNERMFARFALEIDLRRAIGQNELRVHYQPKVSLATGQMTGAEALVRWQHPQRGLVPPAEFIPLAEATGFIQSIGKWVLNEVCSQLRAWQDAGMSVPSVAVNLSAHQFRDENLVAIVDEALRRHGVTADRLDLEITESVLMGDVEGAVVTLGQLRALGVSLSLDDFGTGYSSLSYLKRFPINSLKVDRAFVQDITTSPDDAMICRAIIDLAHNLGLQVVAEGVETEDQLAYLRNHRCDEFQGYLFSRPVPPAEFAAFVTDGKRLVLPPESETLS
jgi:diguanylate cyclase (GGDEF)-like protein/PAS domain S-box-containing protein